MSKTLNPQQLVNEQLAQLQSLTQLLSDEKEVLQQHDPEVLSQLTAQKNTLLVAIQTLDEQLGKHQDFNQQKAAGNFQQELEDIKNLLIQCQKQNEVNGLIIQQSQLAVERMKTTLLDNHNKASVTYDGKGKKQGGLTSLNIKA